MGIKRRAINYGAKQGSWLILNHILVPCGSKKMIRERMNLFVFVYFFGPYIKLRTENLAI